MNQFLFLFRMEAPASMPEPSPQEMQANMKRWMDWLGAIAAQDKLVSNGNRLDNGGKVVKQNNIITDGPYVELKESVGGYSIVKAETIEEASEMAKGCPILLVGGTVEVRPIAPM